MKMHDIPRTESDGLLHFVLLREEQGSNFVQTGRKVNESNETPTWYNTVQVLFLQSHSTCFGRKRPSSRVLKLVQRPLVHVLSLQVSHHITLLGPIGPNKVMCSFDLYYDARKHKIKI